MGLVRTFRGLIKPTSFNITPSSVSVKMGTTYEIPYTVSPSNATNQKIKWTSSNTNIATVSNGIITPVAVGTATITGTTDYLGFTDTVSVEVYVVPVTGVSLNESSITVNAGETFQLVATITPADAGEQGVTWYSSNTSVATVSSNGLVTYVGDGNATITVTTVDGGFTATCSVECVSFVPVDTCFAYTGAEQSIELMPHTYCLEVWGASGYCCSSYSACRGGGYSSGCITITNKTTFYIYVGGHPTGKTGGWNGGGNGYSSYGKGGGGGTDIRVGGNTLYHRIIVAGGSGGNNCSLSCAAGQGGAGGGACGMEGYSNSYCPIGRNRSGGGASQTSGGCAWNTGGSKGTFGQGGTSCSGYNAGGGGGGWYGGGGAYDNDSDNDGRGGGGGSGYTWTASTCSSHPAPSCLSGVPYLTNAICCPGCVSFTSPGGGTEAGHFGHGCVRIRSL